VSLWRDRTERDGRIRPKQRGDAGEFAGEADFDAALCPALVINFAPAQFIGNFNESDIRDKPAWLRSRPPLTDADMGVMTEYYRNRLRALQ
jgi:hypothetical protein